MFAKVKVVKDHIISTASVCSYCTLKCFSSKSIWTLKAKLMWHIISVLSWSTILQFGPLIWKVILDL